MTSNYFNKEFDNKYYILNFEQDPKLFFKKLKALKYVKDKKVYYKRVKVEKGPFTLYFD